MAADDLKRITVSLPPALHQQLLEAVRKDDLTIVHWCRQAIRAKLKEPTSD